MIVTINGKKETFERTLSLLELIKEKGLNKDKIVIERNLEIVPKDKLETTLLSNNDSIEIIAFVGGG